MDSMDPGIAPVRLVPVGALRFVTVPFLGVWLCGWAVGEAFAIAACLGIVGEWIRPGITAALGIHGMPIPWPASIGFLAFLSVWLTFWTFGGLGAIDALLRALWAHDELRMESGRLVVTRASGPFVSRKELDLAALHSLRLRRKDHALVAGMANREITLTDLGTREQRDALLAALRAHVPGGAAQALAVSGDAGLPSGWRPEQDDEGRTVVVRHAHGFSRLGFALWIIAAGIALQAALTLATALAHGPDLLAFMKFGATTFFALLLTVLGVALRLGRSELIVSPSRFGVRYRLAQWQRWIDFGAPRLRVEVRTDSDGDEWFELVAGPGTPRCVVHSRMNEPGEVVAVGHWLAQRLGITLELDPRAT